MNSEHRPGRDAAHLALADIGVEGQARIRDSKIALVGLGGLGCAAAPYLVASGVGTIVLCDFDTVAEGNLARQTLYSPADIGRRKAEVARQRLSHMNPETSITCVEERVTEQVLASDLSDCDMIIDASDNYGTRLAVNRACLRLGIPWVMGACIRMEGQVLLFEPKNDSAACYRCVYGTAPDTLEDCPGAGIMSTVAGLIGVAMAHLALTRLAGNRHTPAMHILDGKTLEWRKLAIAQNPDCEDCAKRRA